MKKSEPLVEVRNLRKLFYVRMGVFRRGVVKAVDDVSFTVNRGETLGLVGESGCGKTTLGRTVIGIYKPTAGKIIFKGHDLAACKSKELRSVRRKMQMIFQNPYSALNPRMKVGDIVGEPLDIYNLAKGAERKERVGELLCLVGLRPEQADCFPHEFSGGQRQRIVIARALAAEPEFLICDEPVSALDVSMQAQIVNMLDGLQKRLNLTYFFISHDLSIVKQISTWVAVMYLGKIVELAGSEELYRYPIHPYTCALMSAVPVPDPHAARKKRGLLIEGEPPSQLVFQQGCRFHPRCPFAREICRESEPLLRDVGETHLVACHFFC